MTTALEVHRVHQMLKQARALPPGAAQIALMEQTVALADTLEGSEMGFVTRLWATHAYARGGEPIRGFVSLGWCRRAYDREPARYASWRSWFLWQFKGSVRSMTWFWAIPLARTHDVLAEMEQRWRSGGQSLHAVHQHRFLVAWHVGDLETAEQEYRRWQTTPRDDLSDCAGCDTTDAVLWLASRGRDAEAIARADPVLAGRLECSSQPHSMQTALLAPYLRDGRREDAVRAQRAAYREHRNRLSHLGQIAAHLRFCTLADDDALGLELLQRHLGWLSRPPTPHADMQFSAAGSAVLSRLGRRGHADLTVRHRAGAVATGAAQGSEAGPDDEVRVGDLAEELRERARSLAERFDQRNGTSHQSDRVRQVLEATAITSAR